MFPYYIGPYLTLWKTRNEEMIMKNKFSQAIVLLNSYPFLNGFVDGCYS